MAVIARMTRLTRALFYLVTVAAALAAVIATNATDDTGPLLSQWSWYLLMGGLVLFAAMVLLQAWSSTRPNDRKRASPPGED